MWKILCVCVCMYRTHTDCCVFLAQTAPQWVCFCITSLCLLCVYMCVFMLSCLNKWATVCSYSQSLSCGSDDPPRSKSEIFMSCGWEVCHCSCCFVLMLLRLHLGTNIRPFLCVISESELMLNCGTILPSITDSFWCFVFKNLFCSWKILSKLTRILKWNKGKKSVTFTIPGDKTIQ